MKIPRYRKLLLPRIATEVIVILLVCLWIYTGLNKLIDYSNTKMQMSRSPFIEPYADFLAIFVPGGEIVLAALLVFKRTRMIGLFGSIFLMAVFTGYIYMMLNYAYDLPCSCGGVLQKLSWDGHLWFNLGFTILAIAGVILQNILNRVSVSESISDLRFTMK